MRDLPYCHQIVAKLLKLPAILCGLLRMRRLMSAGERNLARLRLLGNRTASCEGLLNEVPVERLLWPAWCSKLNSASGELLPSWPRTTRPLTPRSLMMSWLRFLSSSRPGSRKCFDKSVDITCVVIRGERDPNASATYPAHNIMTTKIFYNCLHAFVRVSQ
jgi:hypothetical protein